MNLTIDIGNTRTKLGLFDQGQLIHKMIQCHLELDEFKQWATNQNVKKVILSTVASNLDEAVLDYLKAQFYFLELDAETALPIENAYQTPKTLGKDRLAAIVGAHVLYPNENCLVIDAGTCITYDILQKDGVFLGGNIAPGINLRLKAMHTFTASLPEVESGKITQSIGKSTETAMRIGGQMGAVMEMKAFIDSFEEEFGQIRVILTGGDANFFAKKMKREIFVNHNLVLLGLNKILNYNAECLE